MRVIVASFMLIAGLLGSTPGMAEAPLWLKIPGTAARGTFDYPREARFNGNDTALRKLLEFAPAESSAMSGQVISLPLPDGGLARFRAVESPIMEPSLAARYPQIRTYKVFGLDDPHASGRLDLTHHGFRALLHTASGRITIDPEDGAYRVRKRRGDYRQVNFQCRSDEIQTFSEPDSAVVTTGQRFAMRVSGNFTQYRLAVSATQQYYNAVGGTLDAAMSEIVTAINRVNQVYERDLGIRLQLVANNDLLIDTDGSSGLNNGNLFQLILGNQSWVDTQIGSANYDIGHVFSTANGGLAQIGIVCSASSKARGATGLANPTGETFYIDYVAHEIAHQFDAEHSFNGTTSNCSARIASSAFEPGSGSTIMSYSGICGAESIQNTSDAVFHSESIAQINAYTSAGGSCYTLVNSNNPNEPLADAGNDFIIPVGTPFKLTGAGSDSDGDTVSYQWDQIDLGSSTNSSTLGTDLGDNPLFRSYEPQSDPGRDFPALGTQVDGLADLSETLPCSARNLNFRLTVRDGKGGQAADETTLTVDDTAGPFKLTSHTSGETIVASAGPVSLNWNVANTDNALLNCTAVDIDLLTFSTGHNSYSVTSLATATPNDGSESVNIPDSAANRARFRISCGNNIFYDISDADLVIQGSGSFPTSGNQTFFNIDGETFAAPDNSCVAISLLTSMRLW